MFSKTLEMVHNNEMGRKSLSLLGYSTFGIGVIMAFFQRDGNTQVLKEELTKSVTTARILLIMSFKI